MGVLRPATYVVADHLWRDKWIAQSGPLSQVDRLKCITLSFRIWGLGLGASQRQAERPEIQVRASLPFF